MAHTISINQEDVEYQQRRHLVQQGQAVYALSNAALWLEHLGVKISFTGIPLDKIISGEVKLQAVTIRLIQKKD